jgi:hypothetical protein
LGATDAAVTGFLVVTLANVSLGGYCAHLQSGITNLASSTTLTLSLISETSVVGPGTYSVPGGGTYLKAGATLQVLDANCKATMFPFGLDATGGSVVVSSVTSTTATGTFDLTFGGGSMSGAFSAPICTGVSSTGAAGDAGAICLP